MLAGIRLIRMRKRYIDKRYRVFRQGSSILSSKFLLILLGLLVIVLNFSFVNSALAFSNSPECKGELRRLIVPPLKHVAMSKSIIQTEIDDSNNGVYSVRLFVPADSPDNLDKQVSIGWVNLDVNVMKAYDVTNELASKIELKINRSLYKKYVAECINDAVKRDAAVTSCTTLRNDAEKSWTLIPGSDSGREIIGSGRLQFYSAPDEKCTIPGEFILPNEKVYAYAEFDGYTSVEYTNLKTGSNASGWVRSNRLKPTGLGIAPNQ